MTFFSVNPEETGRLSVAPPPSHVSKRRPGKLFGFRGPLSMFHRYTPLNVPPLPPRGVLAPDGLPSPRFPHPPPFPPSLALSESQLSFSVFPHGTLLSGTNLPRRRRCPLLSSLRPCLIVPAMIGLSRRWTLSFFFARRPIVAGPDTGGIFGCHYFPFPPS